jgi:hypothetical protein
MGFLDGCHQFEFTLIRWAATIVDDNYGAHTIVVCQLTNQVCQPETRLICGEEYNRAGRRGTLRGRGQSSSSGTHPIPPWLETVPRRA